MDVREKLVALLSHSPSLDALYGYPSFVESAEWLIAHGVTVQDKTEISDELLEQLRNTPVTILQEEPTIEVVQQWISVKDRLPEPWKDVLAFYENKTISVDAMSDGGKWYSDYVSTNKTTHWMPLPQPPKGE